MKKLNRIHSLNDLFLALVVLLSIPVNFLLTHYANTAVHGVQYDFKTLAPTLKSYFQIPSAFIGGVVSVIVPFVILLLLVYRRRFWDIMQAFFAAACAELICWLLVISIIYFNNAQLMFGYQVYETADFSTFPTYIAICAAILIVAGPRAREQVVRIGWAVLYACQVLIVIIGISQLMSTVLALQIGYFSGMLLRFGFGRINRRVDAHTLLKIVRAQGLEINELKQIRAEGTRRKRIYLSVGSEKEYRVVVFDPEQKAITILTRVLQFLKLKNFAIKYTSFQSEFEHIALMNYSFAAAGLNFPQLIGSRIFEENMIFVFEQAGESAVLCKEKLTEELQDQFWQQLNLAHQKNIIFQQIDLHQLRIYCDEAVFWVPEVGDISSNSLFQKLDVVQLLVGLSIYAGGESVAKVYLKNLKQRYQKPKRQYRELSQTIALLDKHVLAPAARAHIKQLQRGGVDVLEQLKGTLQAYLDSKSDLNVSFVPMQYKRFSIGKVFTLGLTIVAVMALLTQMNFDAVVLAFSSSNHFWALLSFLLGFITFLGGTVALHGFGHQYPIKLGQAYMVQIAAGWSSIQIPGGLGPLTMNIRYLNKVNPGGQKQQAQNSALAGVVQAAQAICSFVMVFIFGILSGQNVPHDAGEGTVVIVAIVIVAAVLAAALAIPALRKALRAKIWPLIRQFATSIAQAMRSPKGVLIGFSGCIIQELGYALSLMAALHAFGQEIPLANVILIFLIANAAGATSPTPGGLGAIEAALTLGLTTIGAANGAIALSVTLLYRVCIFWVRAPIGILMQKYCERKGVI